MTSQAVLVINSGSSSIKYQYINLDSSADRDANGNVLAKGLIGKIGEETGQIEHSSQTYNLSDNQKIADHRAGIDYILTLLHRSGYDLIQDPPIGIGHRVVNGGPDLWEPTVVDDHVITLLRSAVDLAPLHGPANILGIEIFQEILPQIPNITVFDTGFFHNLPLYSSTYAIDTQLAQKYNIRRYGYHGTSHHYVAQQAAKVLGKSLQESNFIIFHLGNGASVSAILQGKPIDTSMGLTPLEGLVMGTRSGDIDPAIVGYLSSLTEKSSAQVIDILNYQSGLKGLTGTNDLRDVYARASEGDSSAQLACDIYVHRIRKYLGAYWLELGRVDAIIFTAGVGENAAWLRAAVLADLKTWGVIVDAEANERKVSGVHRITADKSRVQALVVPTNEEFAIAEITVELVRSL